MKNNNIYRKIANKHNVTINYVKNTIYSLFKEASKRVKNGDKQVIITGICKFIKVKDKNVESR